MDEFLNAKEVSLSYFDACPSELFVSIDTKYITHVGVHYFMIYKPGLVKIPQFKNSRGIDNKLNWIDYLIENIDAKKIGYYCQAINTEKHIGIENGLSLLIKENIIKTKNIDLNSKVLYHNYNISVKNLIALSWYAVSIILMTKSFATISKTENKQKFAFLFDLLPTDSALSTRNFKLFRRILFDSHLNNFIQEDTSVRLN
ncbi:MAG TPA: hypothetical protein ENO27_00050 [Caldithrix sp.]|nr:hypothetical protein [Caldithrix sp.]